MVSPGRYPISKPAGTLPRTEPSSGRATAGTSTLRRSPVLDPTALAAFFAERGRDLPWRKPGTSPWAVLVSEVMLQQTPVGRVLPVYLKWLARWPTPADLAADSPGEAIRAWERLGYPRRALRLHAAATAIVADHHGQMPSAVADLLVLPGIGEYTARAVAAFAFGAAEPVVDTNVRRVLCRAVRGVDEHGPATATDRAELAALLPAGPGAAARFCAAVMELGALVCTADSPDCVHCPMAGGCAWVLAGRPQGPPRPAAQTWHGTDRQARGALLAVLRAATGPVASNRIDLAWPREAQRSRALASLMADGLAQQLPDGRFALPGPQDAGSSQR